MRGDFMTIPIMFEDVLYTPTFKYYVDEDGNITTHDNKPVENYYSTNGFSYVLLKSNKGRPKFYPIDHLVFFAFKHDEINNYTHECYDGIRRFQLIHLDEDKLNNHVDNLDIVKKEVFIPMTKPDNIVPGKYIVSSFANAVRINDGAYKPMTHHDKSDRDGYLVFSLYCTDSVRPKNIKVHRVVALNFVDNPNPDEFTVVNHIDGNIYNNEPYNLEWVSAKMNSTLASKSGLYTSSNVTTEEVDYVVELLLANGSSQKAVFDLIDHDKYPRLTNAVICGIKAKDRAYVRDDARYDLTKIKFKNNAVRLTDDEIDMCIEALLAHDSSPIGALEDIDHEKYPYITKHVMQRIKGKHKPYIRPTTKYDLANIEFKACYKNHK